MALTAEQQKKMAELAAIAVAEEKVDGYPPALVIAQWAIESGWGDKESGKFNYFGITKAPRHTDFKMVATREVLTQKGIESLDPDERATITSQKLLPSGKFEVRLRRKFASYASMREGVADQMNLIRKGRPYKPAFDQFRIDKDADKLARAIAAKYATDPNYGTMVVKIMAQKNVQAAIAKARATAV